MLARPPSRWIDGRPLLALAMVPVGFFTGYPYALLRYRPFLEHVGWIRRFQEYDAGERLEFIFGYGLESGFGTAAVLVLLAACLWFLYGGHARYIALVVYLAVSLYMLTHNGHRLFPRYLLPLLPAAAVLVGALLTRIATRLGGLVTDRSPVMAPALAVVLTAVVVTPQMRESLAWTADLKLPDTHGPGPRVRGRDVPA